MAVELALLVMWWHGNRRMDEIWDPAMARGEQLQADAEVLIPEIERILEGVGTPVK